MMVENPINRGSEVAKTDNKLVPQTAASLLRYQPASPEDILTVEQCASWLQIEVPALMEEVKSERIPTIHLGEQLRFNVRAVLEALISTQDHSEQRRQFQRLVTPMPRIVDRIHVQLWLSVKEAAHKLDVSTDTIERRAIPWQPESQPYKVRYKNLVLDKGGNPTRRYYEPDLEKWMYEPRTTQSQLTPRFKKQGFTH